MVTDAREADIRFASASTVSVPPKQKFDFFCDAICDVYAGIRPTRSTDHVFDADFSAYTMGSAVLARISAPGHNAARDRDTIRSRPDHSLFLNFNLSAACMVRGEQGEAAVAAGTPLLLDNDRPFELAFDGSRRMVLYSLRLDRARLPVRSDDIAAANRRIWTTPFGAQLARQMQLLCEMAETRHLAVAQSMTQSVIALLGDLCAGEFGEPGGRAKALEEVAALAHDLVADPDFDLERLSRLSGRSPRSLQMRFRTAGTSFSAWLLETRLNRAQARLERPRWQTGSVKTVAHSCGFRDLSHFHRSFKSRFGVTPAAYRAGAVT